MLSFGRLGRKQFGALLGALVAVAVCAWPASAQVTINSATLTANDNAAIGGVDPNGAVTFINSTGVVPTLNLTGTFETDRNMILTNTGEIEVDAGQALTVNGIVSGAGALRVDGDGTLILAGVNTYGGNTEIMGGGVVQVTAANNLGNAANDIVFTSEGGTLLITGAGFVDNTRNILLNAAGTIDVESGTVTFTQAIQNNGGALTKDGDGTLVLTASSVYNRGTILAGGAITVTDLATSGNLGNGALTFADSGGGTPVLNINDTTISAESLDINLTSDGAINVIVGETATMQGDVTGAGQLQVVGAGTLILGDTTNNYTGGTQIQSGTLQVAAGGSLGSGAVDFSAGGTGVLAVSDTTTVANAITLTGDGTISTAAGEGATFSGLVSGAGALAITGGGTTVLSNGANNFTGGVDIVNGTLNVTAAGALGAVAGGVEFNAGVGQTATLEIGHGINVAQDITLTSSGTVDVSLGGSAILSGQISGGAAQVLTIAGGGSLVLANATNDFLGGVTITDGTLSVANAAALSTGDITFNAAGVATADLAITDSTTVSNNLTLASAGLITVSAGETATINGLITGGAGNLLTVNGPGTTILSNAGNNFAGGVAIETGTLQVADLAALGTADSVALTNGGTLNLSALGTVAGTLAITVATGETGTISGAGLTGAGGLTVDGGGTLMLGGANGGLAGGIVLVDGTLSIADSAALGVGDVEFAGVGGTVPTLEMTADMTVTNDIILTSSGTLATTGDATATVSGDISGAGVLNLAGTGNTILSGAVSNTGGVSVAGSGAVTISGLMDGAGGLAIGGGTTTLTNAANTFTGDVNISRGTLAVSSDGQLGDAANDILFSAIAGSATLEIDGAVPFTTAREINLGAVEAVEGRIVVTGSATHNGTISGVNDLVKAGDGTLTLTGDNSGTFTGGFTVTAGTLEVTQVGALGGDAQGVTFAGVGATLAFTLGAGAYTSTEDFLLQDSGTITSNATSLQLDGDISGAGAAVLTLDGSSDYILTGAISGPVGLNLSAGTVTFDLGAAVTSTINGVISGSGFTLDGDGTLVLAGLNTFIGEVLILGGTLEVNSEGGLGNGANNIEFGAGGNGTLEFGETLTSTNSIQLTGAATITARAGVTATLNGAITGDGPLTLSGPGAVVLGGANGGLAGGIVLVDGTLAIADPAALGSGSVTFAGVGGVVPILEMTATMTVANDIVLTSSGELSATNGVTATMTGLISGAGQLVIGGSGTVVLNHAVSNTFSGGVQITNGTLQISADGQLGDAAGTIDFNAGVGDRATLAVETAAGAFSSARDITLSGAESGQIEVLSTGLATFSGNITGTGALDISGTGDAVLSGTIDNEGGLSVSSSGDVTISGLMTGEGGLSISGGAISTTTLSNNANTFTGNVTVTSGTLAVSNDGQLGDAANDIVFNAAVGAVGTLVIDGAVPFVTARDINFGAADAGDGRITVTGTATHNGLLVGVNDLFKAGAGTLILTGNNVGFTGGFTISAGTLEVTQVGALGGDAQGVTFAGVDVTLAFTLGAGAFTSTEDFLLQDSATITSDATSLRLEGGISGGGSVLTLDGLTNYTLAGPITGSLGMNLSAGTVTFDLAPAITSTINGVLSGSGFTLDGGGTLVLGGTNAFVGDVRIVSGTLDINSVGALGAAGNNIEFVAGGTGTINLGTSLTAANTIELNADANITIEGGVTATLSGVISGAGALTVGGTGTVVLGGANTLTGNVVINRATVQVGTNGALGGTTSVELTEGGTLSATNDVTIGAGVTVSVTSAAGGAISVASGKTLTISGDMTGADPLALSGAGTLAINGDASGLTGALTVGGSSTLDLGAAAVYGGDITVGAGTRLDGNGTILGGVTVNGGTIAPGNSPGTLTMDSLTMDASGNMEFEIEGVGALQADRIVLTNAGVAATIAAGANLTIIQSAFIPTGNTSQYLDATNGGTLTIGAIDVLVRLIPAGGTAQPVLSIQTWSFDETNGEITTTRAADAFQEAVTAFGGTSQQISSGAAVDVMAAFADTAPTSATAQFVYDIQSQATTGAQLLALVSGLAPNDYAAVSQMPLQSMRFFERSQMEYNDSRRRAYGMAQWWASQQASRVAGASDAAIVAGLAAGQAALADPSAGGRRMNVYGRVLGGTTSYDGNPSQSGYDQTTWQTTFGVDYVVDSGFLIGIAGGYSSDNANMNDGASADANSVVFDPYCVWGEDEGFFAEVHGYAAVSFWDTSRVVAAASSTASGSFTGWSAGVAARGGYDWYLNDEFRITPELSLLYLYTQAPSFTETGAGVANLNVASRDQSNAVIQLGPEFGWDYELTGGRYVSFGVSFGWEYLFGDQSDVVASFASGGASFATAISSPDRSRFFMGLSCDWPIAESWDMRLEYEGMFSGDTSANGGSATFSYHF